MSSPISTSPTDPDSGSGNRQQRDTKANDTKTNDTRPNDTKANKEKSARYIAFEALRAIGRGAFADVVLDRQLNNAALSPQDKALVTELVYGTVRRQRTLDALIDQFGKRKASQQQADLLQILRLGFYQLRYLNHVPNHAVVDTTVQLAKAKRLGKLSGVVNGMLRSYIRQSTVHQSAQPGEATDPLKLPEETTARLGIFHSYPDWIVQIWQSMLPDDQVASLCKYFNQPPNLDLRIDLRRHSIAEAQALFATEGVELVPVAGVPSALRLAAHSGAVNKLPGYAEGWWAVQDSSAQLVSYLLDPQPGETVIDACGAPGGKSLHIAALMGDEGTVWSCDRTPSRTKKIQKNIDRLTPSGHSSIVRPLLCDSRNQPTFAGKADRVLLDVPCSGLGTLNRHADARWRQTPDSVAGLVTLQRELLGHASTWVKPGGVMVYSTCTLHPDENEAQIQWFLDEHAGWSIVSPPPEFGITPAAAGWIKVWPHEQQMDGFFMVKLVKAA